MERATQPMPGRSWLQTRSSAGSEQVGGVVVADDVQSPPRVGLGYLLEEAQELLVTVPRQAAVDDLAGGDLERGEQRGGAVFKVLGLDVVVSGLLRHPGHDRQDRRGPLQRLDLRLLVDTENHGVLRWVQIQ